MGSESESSSGSNSSTSESVSSYDSAVESDSEPESNRAALNLIMRAETDSGPPPPGVVVQLYRRLQQKYQKLLDDVTPFMAARWGFAVLFVLSFLVRIFLLQGWYIVTYALGIYHLNLFIAFLSPKIDPALADYDDDGPELPTRSNEEFRPFIRRLPEFKFWYSVTKSTVIAIVCTFFEFCNIPVFWPILVMYFVVLFSITMKRQIKHMIKYRYLPFTHSKPRYQTNEEPLINNK